MGNSEKFTNRIKKNDDNELMELYTLFKTEFDETKEKLSLIKDEFAERLHSLNKESNIIPVNDVNWKIAYQTTSRKKTNYIALLETVGNEEYNNIVTSKESTFLVIRKAPKTKKSKKTQTVPIMANVE